MIHFVEATTDANAWTEAYAYALANSFTEVTMHSVTDKYNAQTQTWARQYKFDFQP